MEWAVGNFPDDRFYTSCDDDIMIDLAGLIDVVRWHKNKAENENWNNFFIICSYKTRLSDKPDRRSSSIYYLSVKEYKWKYFPDFCLGGAYTTNIKVIRQLWDASREVKPLRMDDVWITGILRERIGMPRQYVRNLEVPVATHHYGFYNVAKETIQENWSNLQEKFKHLRFCM